MKNETTSLPGFYATRRYNPLNGQQDSTTSPGGFRRSTIVAGAAIVKGNRKSPNPWAFTIQRISGLEGTSDTRQPNIWIIHDGQLPGPVLMDDLQADVQKCQSIAITKCVDRFYSNLRSQSAALDITAGEMMKNASDSAARRAEADWKKYSNGLPPYGDARQRPRATAYRTATKSQIRRGVAKGSDLWVASRYGWFPVIQDLFTAGMATTDTFSRRGFTVKAQGGSTSSPSSENAWWQDTLSGRWVKLQATGSISARCEYAYSFRINPGSDTLARLASLDPARLAWELVPYSFVVDWFTGFGNCLEQLEAKAKYQNTVIGGRQTITTRAEAKYSFRGNISLTRYSVETSVVRKTLSRTIYHGLPGVNKPRLQCDLGSGRLLNAAALLGQRLGRR